MTHRDDAFDRSAALWNRSASLVHVGGDAETWGENKHGYFSLSSGRFIEKSKDEFMKPKLDVAWPMGEKY